MYDHTLYLRRKHFCCCCCCLQALSIEKILKFYVKDCSKINGKQMIKMPKKGESVDLKIMKGN